MSDRKKERKKERKGEQQKKKMAVLFLLSPECTVGRGRKKQAKEEHNSEKTKRERGRERERKRRRQGKERMQTLRCETPSYEYCGRESEKMNKVNETFFFQKHRALKKGGEKE